MQQKAVSFEEGLAGRATSKAKPSSGSPADADADDADRSMPTDDLHEVI
jgi:hypothetical protein